MDTRSYWDDIYNRKQFTEVTWYQSKPQLTLKLIEKLQRNKEDFIIDVGAGSSTLSDYLLEKGYANITVVDISLEALKQSQKRLGGKSSLIKWIDGDITELEFHRKFRLWHDRAVFHFLTTQDLQNKYIQNILRTLENDGFIIISTFAENGPLKCSGLEIIRYSKDELIQKFKDNFECLDFQKETHISPSGMEQKFNYWVFKRVK